MVITSRSRGGVAPAPSLTTMHRLSGLIILLGLLFGPLSNVQAHDPGLSVASLTLTDKGLRAQVTFARGDIEALIAIDTNHDGAASSAEVNAARISLQGLAESFFDVSVDGRKRDPQSIQVKLVQSDGLHFQLLFPGNVQSGLGIRSMIMDKLARGHRQYLSVVDDKGVLLTERMLGGDRRGLELMVGDNSSTRSGAVDPTQALSSTWTTFFDYVHEGVRHIWIGTDHVLFLICLLLPAVLRREGRRWRAVTGFRAALMDVLKVVTAFTLAHSITLALAALDVIVLPSRWVESAIAASVLIAALNNLYPLWSGRAWIVAFLFGLIHGMGFANVLRELGLPEDSLLSALVAFNLGVEFGQLAIVGLFLPIAYSVRHAWFYQRLTLQFGSSLIAVIGLVWLFERGLSFQSSVTLY